jgi:hypothetical protein
MTNEAPRPAFVIRHSGFVICPMFLAHSIRLRDPWQCEAMDDGGERWSRRFHRPTGLEADDQLLLVLSGLPAGTVVRVNGHGFDAERSDLSDQRSAVSGQQSADPFPPASSDEHQAASSEEPASAAVAAQFDLTAILGEANEIEIEVPADPLRRVVDPRLPASFPYDARLAIIGHS